MPNTQSVRLCMKANVWPNGKIDMCLDRVSGDMQEEISRWVVDTMDKTIRRALEDLGWTPPKEIVEQKGS